VYALKVEYVGKRIVQLFRDLVERSVEVRYEPPKFREFPFKWAYVGQNDAIERICSSQFTYLAPHTGAGKTAVFVTAARVLGEPTVIIEPRVFLQEQVCQYARDGDIIYLASRKRHPCPLIDKLPEWAKKFFDKDLRPCDFRVGDYFYVARKKYEFPCPDCPYEILKDLVRERLDRGGIVVLNQGNFKYYLKAINDNRAFVIVDEADEVLRSVTAPIVVPKRAIAGANDVEDVLDNAYEFLKRKREKILDTLDELEEDLEKNPEDSKLLEEIVRLNNSLEQVERDLDWIRFYGDFARDVFYYEKGGAVYIEALPSFVWFKRFFWNCRVCLVTATPPPAVASSGEVVSYEVPFKAKVVVAPLYNMSKTQLSKVKDVDKVFERVAKFMQYVSRGVQYVLRAKRMKVVVHCANFDYVNRIKKYFDKPLVHDGTDKLENVIRVFNESEYYEWLFVVSAEYGGDFKGVPLQFVLKVPYPPLDERTEAMREKIGEDRFRAWYEYVALSQMIQATGRNARKPTDPAVTVIIDRSAVYLLKKYYNHLPEWFRKRLVFMLG